MRSSALTIALCAAFLSGGCGTDEPLQAPTPLLPTPTPLPTPSIVPAEMWDLTATLRAVTGPACLIQNPPLGRSINWPLQIWRNGSAITLLYGDPFDNYRMEGSVDGKAFTAAGPLTPGPPHLCDNLEVGSQFQLQVVGQFAAHGSELSARYTTTDQFDTLKPLVYSWDWRATRR